MFQVSWVIWPRCLLYAVGHDVLTSYNPRAKVSIPRRETERTALSLFTLSLCSCFYLILNQQQQHRYFSLFYLTTKTFFLSFVASPPSRIKNHPGFVILRGVIKKVQDWFNLSKNTILKKSSGPSFFYSSMSEVSSETLRISRKNELEILICSLLNWRAIPN